MSVLPLDRGQLSSDEVIATGLSALCFAARAHHINVDPHQLAHAIGMRGKPVSVQDLLLAAKKINLLADVTTSTWDNLSALPLPVLAELDTGDFIVIIGITSGQVVIFDPKQPGAPRVVDRSSLDKYWTGNVILLRPAETELPQKFGLRWFLPAILKYRNVLTEVIVAALFIQIFALATPLFSQAIIDKVIVHKNFSTLHVLGVGMVIIIVFEAVLSVLQTHLMTHTANRIDVALSSRVVEYMLSLPLRFFEVRRVGDTVAQVRELENIRQFITGNSITAVLDLFFIALFLAAMFYYSAMLSWVVLGTLPFFIALSLAIRPLMRGRLEDRFNHAAASQAFLVEAVSGIYTIKALAVEPVTKNIWDRLLSRYATASFRTSHLAGIAGALSQAVQKVSTLAILWTGAELVMSGDLSVGQMIAFQMLSGRVIQPAMRIVQLWQDFQQVAISVERLGDIMNTAAEPTLDAGKPALPALQGEISIAGIFFRYSENGPPILRGLDFTASAGQTIGIVGRSGSGKSTLAKLLQRLYVPNAGRITIDGHDIAQVDPAWLRRQIGIVLQENFLFNNTIRANIAYHVPHAPMAAIIHAAQLAGAHEFISGLPNGYETCTGERGIALSGGQRQRIAIARALLANPRILIFDEATSALDYESEQIIQENLNRICAGRTVFMIAHRLSTIRRADNILVMDQGAVVEQGTHHALLARRGLYHHLFTIQEGTNDAAQTA